MAVVKPIKNYLKVILGNDVEPDIIDYINSMKHEEDLEEFMENIIDKNNTAHTVSYESIKNILFGKKKALKKQSFPNTKANENVDQNMSKSTIKGNKGKKKFSDINTFEQKVKKEEGRKICDCEGQVHEFMNNCLNCGRIHCFEEGPGPCFFCGEIITIMGEEVFPANNQKSKTKANMTTRHKENRVFDDDKDYFKASDSVGNSSKDNKHKLVIALDFATRKVIESTQEDLEIKNRLHKDIKKHLENVDKLYKKLQRESESQEISNNNNDLIDLLIQMRHKRPFGIEDLGEEDSVAQVIDYGSKVYDEDMIANTDHGLCLSMHQPFASLLVAGVKKHEGRSWRTNHRGRLWIAAAAKMPDEDEVSALETFYRRYYNDSTIKFPKDYPTSCLLGCVFVEDCLDQETYRKQYPNGESDSPYVLICSNPIILPIFYPIVGKHKIYALDKELHNCAKMSIRYAKYMFD